MEDGSNFHQHAHRVLELPGGVLDLPLRGVIGYHPRPKILRFEKNQDQVSLEWHGPASELANATDNSTHKLHLYHIERASSLIQPDWTSITDPSHDHQVSFREPSNGAVFYRVVLEIAPLETR